MNNGRARRGFTLLELLVALTVGAVAIGGAASALWSITEHARHVAALADEADRRANGLRILRQLAGAFETGSRDGGFAGDTRTARFASRCRTTDGGYERCWVHLALESGSDTASGARLIAELPGAAPIELLRGLIDAELRFLLTADRGGQWMRIWGEGISAPLAIGVVTAADTLIVRVGAGQ